MRCFMIFCENKSAQYNIISKSFILILFFSSLANAASDLSVSWQFSTEMDSPIRAAPAVQYGMLVFGNYDGELYGISEKTGTFIWRYQTQNAIESSPVISGDRLYIGSNDQHLYCLNLFSGNLIWSYKTEDSIQTTPCVINEIILVTSGSKLYCLNALSGKEIWATPFETNGTLTSPVFNIDRAYVGSQDRSLYAVKIDNKNDKRIYPHNDWISGAPAFKDNNFFQ
ncbi:MAG: pyrrolo-quinoline quinone [Candidatus Magnetoglobus multicellularis str. Araruama]|uniref:Pyrrolo-quinoline quinone n=1 Tax=Candidatus Magnetoglobus multicellularis str. Araruama TaxID=890399 RepID=A0A1V1NUA4_9BACT|nr:MAG: pyrrolo-quinoline quinone [Candidatus Magnetoglobus multicellularis str. Araruama]